jgi:hypothetical protein
VPVRLAAGQRARAAAAPTCSSDPCMTDHGGPVLHANTAYVIYWQPPGAAGVSAFPSGYQQAINDYFTRVAQDAAAAARTNVYAVATQYRDANGAAAAYGSSFSATADTYLATDPLPAPDSNCSDPHYAACVTDAQIQHEIDAVATRNHWPRGVGSIFFLATPPGLGSCIVGDITTCFNGGGGFCAYHGDFASASGETIYANVPDAAVAGCQNDPTAKTGYHPNPGTADATLSTLSHEHIETITDPEGQAPGTKGAWYNTGTGEEIADICAKDFGNQLGLTSRSDPATSFNQQIAGKPYELQTVWSNADKGCMQALSAPSP